MECNSSPTAQQVYSGTLIKQTLYSSPQKLQRFHPQVKMYDPIFAKSFSRYDRRRFGCCALVLSLIVALTICSTFKPSLHPLTIIGEAVRMQVSISAIEDLLIQDGIAQNSGDEIDNSSKDLQKVGLELPQFDQKSNSEKLNPKTTWDDAGLAINNTSAAREEKLRPKILKTTSDDTAVVINNTSAAPEEKLRPKILKTTSDDTAVVINNTAAASEQKLLPPRTYGGQPLCRVLKGNADFCEIEGDIRVDSNSSTIYLFTPANNSATSSSWIIQPYPRKGIAFVRNWTVRYGGAAAVPECTENHSTPAILFSIGGFTGNHFHDFADVLFPLFTTSFRSNREIQFLVSDYKPWWLAKYRPILDRLSRHVIIDIDHEKHVRCFPKLTAGLNYHRELMAEPSSEVTMSQFRRFLRQTYSLGRTTAGREGGLRPRLFIVSRKWTRIIINEGEVSRLARKMGYEVISAESDTSSNQTAVAQLVNTCDVMVGVHGAGLTNMVFLPEKAVVIQIVPLGKIDIFAKLDFGDPSKGMNIRYLDYDIGFGESSLSEKYAADDPVIKDPQSIHRQGWGKLREVYLHNQNVTIDVRRFRTTLAKALKLLRR